MPGGGRAVTAWRHWVYPFPADDGVDLLWEVLDRMPEMFGAVLDWTLTDKFVVAVADVNAAVYLRMALDGSRLPGTNGVPILEHHEVLVADSEREECERLLRENCPAEAEWFRIIVVHAQTEAAWLAFDEAYRAVVCGTPLSAIA